MAVPSIRGLSLLRHRLQLHLHLHLYPYHHRVATTILAYRLWSTLSGPTRLSDHFAAASLSAGQTISVLNNGDPTRIPKCDGTDVIKWKKEEAEILNDIEHIICATKRILHSDRYFDGECLTAEDEKLVLERLLAYHPHSEDKIGCGIDSIMVDKHPKYRCSRCLFVVRTDGAWIDFSYQKCLRAYIREQYPSCAERFIKKHFKRGSS